MKTQKTIKTISSVLIIITMIVFMASCTERIDIDLNESYSRLVVEGLITTDTMAHTIRLTSTTSYFYAEKAPGVENATVTIDDGESLIELIETEPGIYKTPSDYYGLPGRTYKLNIHLASPLNEKTDYQAESYLNLPSALDSINSVFHDDWGPEGYYEIRCYVLDPPTTDYYMFKVYKNNILMSDSLNKVMVTDDRFYNGSYTNGVGIGFLNQDNENEIVNSGDTLAIESSRITEEYYRFITQLQIQSGYQNPMFSGPPANITGNINNGAIGFFATYPVSRSKTIVSE